MTREDFRIVPNYYTTNALTYILYGTRVVGFAETFKDNFYVEIEPDVWKCNKKKRTATEVQKDCEKTITKLIEKGF